ncbi:hypothetical protein [Chitinophaga sp.]|uniref:hypothetical protein n=1 Tax=Chitinophaga sp. TaxID=1869181 RepID=UPI0031E22A5A
MPHMPRLAGINHPQQQQGRPGWGLLFNETAKAGKTCAKGIISNEWGLFFNEPLLDQLHYFQPVILAHGHFVRATGNLLAGEGLYFSGRYDARFVHPEELAGG